MKIPQFAMIGLFSLTATVSAIAGSKTTVSEKVNPKVIKTDPYRFNGVVLTAEARGSGFCAGDSRLFFSAAHVVFDPTGWGPPPIWHAQVNAETTDDSKGITARGYLRWANYADLVTTTDSDDPPAFSRDVMLGFAFRDLIKGKPARINFDGKSDLQDGARSMITGYPAKNPYLEKNIEGYFMHRTEPKQTKFKTYSGNAIQATLITTGPGNSGGPVWTGSNKTGWKAAGVLVGGLPSETIVYSFTSSTRTMLNSALKTLEYDSYGVIDDLNLGASSLFFVNRDRTAIPDGIHRWKDIGIQVQTFEDRSIVTKASLSLSISTPHRGDLQVILASPSGMQALIHNEEGAGKNDLIIKDMDLTANFAGLRADGRWVLRIQDRLKGDIAVFNNVRLEVAAEKVSTPPVP